MMDAVWQTKRKIWTSQNLLSSTAHMRWEWMMKWCLIGCETVTTCSHARLETVDTGGPITHANIKTCKCYQMNAISKWGRSESRQACNLQKRTTTTLFLAGGWSRLLGHSCLGVIKEILVLNGNLKYEFIVQNVHRTEKFPFIAVWRQETFLSCIFLLSPPSRWMTSQAKFVVLKQAKLLTYRNIGKKEYAIW